MAGLGLSTVMAAEDATSPTINKSLSGNRFSIKAAEPARNYNFSFGFTSNDSDSRAALEQGSNSPFDQWQRRLEFRGNTVSENGISVKFSGEIRDSRKILGRNVAGLHVRGSDNWEQHTLGKTNLQVGGLDDRVKFTLLYDWSDYDASDKYLKSLINKKDEDKARFWGQRDTEGSALSQRLDFRLLQSKHFDASVYGEHRVVSPFFENNIKTKKNDIFEEENQEDFRYGTILNLGPMKLDLGIVQTQKAGAYETDSDFRMEKKFTSMLSLNTSKLRRFAGSQPGDEAWSVIPQSVWMSYSTGRVDYEDGDASPSDATSDVGIGTSWHRGNFSLDLSFWQSLHDGRQIGTEDYEWSGRGMEIGYSVSDTWWSLGGHLSYGRYGTTDDEFSGTADDSFDSSFWAWIDPDEFPTISTKFNWGMYGSEYQYASTGYNYRSHFISDYWTLNTALNFTKFLPEEWKAAKPDLKLVYLLKGAKFRSEDDFFNETDFENEHIVAVRFTSRF